IVACLAFFFAQTPFHHGLRRDAGMVGARHPERVVPLHAPPANEDLLKRVVERVPHVQRAGDGRRWDCDAVRLSVWVGSGVKVSLLFPEIEPALLGRMGIVLLGKFDRHGSSTFTAKTQRTLSGFHSSSLSLCLCGELSSSLNNLYSNASTNASQLASMMFSLTPTVPQTSPLSRHSITTRTRAAVSARALTTRTL